MYSSPWQRAVLAALLQARQSIDRENVLTWANASDGCLAHAGTPAAPKELPRIDEVPSMEHQPLRHIRDIADVETVPGLLEGPGPARTVRRNPRTRSGPQLHHPGGDRVRTPRDAGRDPGRQLPPRLRLCRPGAAGERTCRRHLRGGGPPLLRAEHRRGPHPALLVRQRAHRQGRPTAKRLRRLAARKPGLWLAYGCAAGLMALPARSTCSVEAGPERKKAALAGGLFHAARGSHTLT